MESGGTTTPARVDQYFEPSMEWVPEDDADTLLVYLPGFAKEDLRVQLSARNLIISGERKLEENTWSRFRVEFPVSVNCNLNKISAKFEGNILFVRQPKLITPVARPKEEKSMFVAPATPTVQNPTTGAKGMTTAQRPTNVAQTETPTPPLQPNVEEKNPEVPKTRLEEMSKKRGKTEEKTMRKEPSVLENKNNKVANGELDKTTKTVLENNKPPVGLFATKLKTSSNAVVVLLVGLVAGVVVLGLIKPWTKV